ncbi:MAG: aldo/keto reductase [Bacteroidales bacterium]|nr:aldo/keto reductase [Bacteroidales bacterium]
MKQNRRGFLKNAFVAGTVTSIAPAVLAKPQYSQQTGSPINNVDSEWRNKQEGMHYRMLGRTGFMVSEIVMGAIGKKSLPYVREALDMGLNYFDTATRYAAGRCEEAIGLLNADGLRERYFIATKISEYLLTLDEYCLDALNSMPTAQQERIRKRAKEHMHNRGVMKYGYYFKYFTSQDEELPSGYLTHAVLKEKGYSKEWKLAISNKLQESLDSSLKRLKTGYIDILHCPHGARLPEELDDEIIHEFMVKNIKAGKVRKTGISIHSDVPQVLEKAVDTGKYDMAMVAYNIINQGSMEMAIRKAAENNVGIVAMKAARCINRTFDKEKVQKWRLDKLNQAIPGRMKPELKAYMWVLQNPNVASVVSAMNNSKMVKENLELAGKKINLDRV